MNRWRYSARMFAKHNSNLTRKRRKRKTNETDWTTILEYYDMNKTFPEGHFLTEEDLISVDMFDIELDYDLNKEGTTSRSPRKQVSVSH